MRRLANIFLILFLVSAVATLLSTSAALFDIYILPQALPRILRAAVSLCGALLYIGYGFNRRLPLTILLPLQLWLLWALIDYWPLESAVGPHYAIYASVVQLILGTIILHINKLINGRSLLFNRRQFDGSGFSGKRLLKFALANILIVPLLLPLVGFSLASTLIERNSAGFVRLKPDGLYMIERSYRRNGKQIQLMGMIHLARPQYYQELTAAIPQRKTLILMEGVSDRKGLLKERFSYGKVADLLGLTAQQKRHFEGRLIDRESLTLTDEKDTLKVDLLPADVDISRFEPETIEILNALARYVLNAENPLSGYLAFGRWVEQNRPEGLDGKIMSDLLDKRNDHLVSLFSTALDKYDNLVVPWGALHMKDLEQAVLTRGFSPAESRQHLSIDFRRLPLERLWKGLANPNQTKASNEPEALTPAR